jgi:hypothetical protein
LRGAEGGFPTANKKNAGNEKKRRIGTYQGQIVIMICLQEDVPEKE